MKDIEHIDAKGQKFDEGNNHVTVDDIEHIQLQNALLAPKHKTTSDKPASHKNDLLYNITEIPPWYTCLLLGFQHYIAMFIGNLAAPLLLADAMCMKENPKVKAELVGVQFFVCGIITILQVSFGVRLPIVQGSTFSLLVPILSYLHLPKNSCPQFQEICDTAQNNSNISCLEKYSPEYEEIWKTKLSTIQGSIMIASLLEILLGLTGTVGLLLRFIGPLSICPTIALLGLSLFSKAAEFGSQNWAVCAMTLVFLITFSQYMSPLKIPVPRYRRKEGCNKSFYPLFKMFPVILAVLLSWLICHILTVTNAIPDNSKHWAYGARTDLQSHLVKDAPWFAIFWPGKYGKIRMDVSLVLGLFAGVMTSILESLGDYHACARMAGAPPPPKHAINRGILVEGCGCMLAGLFGTGGGTTSISQNIGVIGLTRVGSRIVIIYTSVFMMSLAVFNKFGSLFVTVPDPIIGAAFMVLFGMVLAVGLSNLQYIDMNSSRNLFVFGFSFFMGLTISEWMKQNRNVINTGIEEIDSICTVLLSTSMFVGGVLGFILDNTVPGTMKERGMLHQDNSEQHQSNAAHEDNSATNSKTLNVYELPCFGKYLNKVKIFKYIPICPPYGQSRRSSNKLDISGEMSDV